MEKHSRESEFVLYSLWKRYSMRLQADTAQHSMPIIATQNHCHESFFYMHTYRCDDNLNSCRYVRKPMHNDRIVRQTGS